MDRPIPDLDPDQRMPWPEPPKLAPGILCEICGLREATRFTAGRWDCGDQECRPAVPGDRLGKAGPRYLSRREKWRLMMERREAAMAKEATADEEERLKNLMRGGSR